MYFKMLYYLRLTVVSPGPAEVGFLACNLLCYSSLIETSDSVKLDSPILKCFIFSLKLATEVDRGKHVFVCVCVWVCVGMHVFVCVCVCVCVCVHVCVWVYVVWRIV